MEERTETIPEFDGRKVMCMSRDEAIKLLGSENAKKVAEGLKNRTLTYKDFDAICKDAFPLGPQKKLVRDVIFTQLSDIEAFCLFEQDKQKQQEYEKIKTLMNRAENGELTKADLKALCDKIFGSENGLSEFMQNKFIENGKIKQEETEKAVNDYTNNQEQRREIIGKEER